MAENKSKSGRLPQFHSLGELVEFFETHDMGDYWDQMPEVDFEVDIKTRRHLVGLDEEIADKVTEIAKAKQVPSEALINAWLREKISESAERVER
jgi:hypothetical protein